MCLVLSSKDLERIGSGPLVPSLTICCLSPSPMDIPLYQHLQLSPPSPKPDQSLFHYPCSPSFAADAFHLGYLGASSTTPPSAAIDSPELLMMHPLMEQPPAPKLDTGNDVQGVRVGLERAVAARKDRHSKICTASGMRDRRMRLSLDVARKFFALQDLLGFDKASKTVQWLLNTSKGAIREIMTDEASSESEEDGSSSLSVVDGKHKPPAEVGRGGQKGDHSEGKKPARARKASTTPKPSRKLGNGHPFPDKESRAKARERARERTREKNRMRWVTLASAVNVEAATAAAKVDEPRPSNSNRSSSMNMLSAELEERCSSSTLDINGGRMQEMSMASEASDVILAGNGGYGSSYYQEQWELGEVVFANSRFC